MVIESGQIIKRLREDRFLKSSDIERLSRSIAESKKNDQFYIAHATLADIEEKRALPSVYKIFSLAVAFKISLNQMLLVFGIDSREADQLALSAPPSQTALEPADLTETDVSFRLNFDNRVNPKETNLLPGRPEEWGTLPAALLKRLQPRRFIYALVGVEDDSMDDLIPPGSLIEIDKEQNKIEESYWRTLRERPIYLVWHENGYSCGWCQQDRNELTVLPHPVSRQRVMRFKSPREASIVGRIVHAWCPLEPVSPLPTSPNPGSTPQ